MSQILFETILFEINWIAIRNSNEVHFMRHNNSSDWILKTFGIYSKIIDGCDGCVQLELVVSAGLNFKFEIHSKSSLNDFIVIRYAVDEMKDFPSSTIAFHSIPLNKVRKIKNDTA